MSGYILMRDTEAWAKLYDLSRAQDRDLGWHYCKAELAGADPGTAFYLPPDEDTVVPVNLTSRQHPFDADDYATREITFTRVDNNQPVAVITYRVDGRA